jgi:hypothetical protein
MIRNDRCLYIGGEAINRVAFRHCLRVYSDIFNLVSIRLLQGYFSWRAGRRSSRSPLANSLISNESIKSDPVKIVIKNYLRFYQTEVRSV